MYTWTDGSDYLMHHGILGQKWGVRRFQNLDGSYTSEGKKRRRDERVSPDEKRKRELSKKPSSELSNKELRELNERYNLESQRTNYERKGRTWFSIFNNKLKEQSAQAIAGALVGIGMRYLKKHLRDIF